MFALITSPLIATLTGPEIRFSTKNYEIREIVGAITPMQLSLIKKGFITERCLGMTHAEDLPYGDIQSLTIVKESTDTTLAIIGSGDKNYNVAFHR